MEKTVTPKDRKQCVDYILTHIKRIAHELIDSNDILPSIFLDLVRATVLLQHAAEPDDKLTITMNNEKGELIMEGGGTMVH